MKTVNISLTKEQTNFIDGVISKYGFANRSEFFRSILRLILREPKIINQADSLILEAPDTKQAKDILAGFSKTKKYSKAFLKDLETGLKRSSYFRN